MEARKREEKGGNNVVKGYICWTYRVRAGQTTHERSEGREQRGMAYHRSQSKAQ